MPLRRRRSEYYVPKVAKADDLLKALASHWPEVLVLTGVVVSRRS